MGSLSLFLFRDAAFALKPLFCLGQYVKKNNKKWGVAAIFATRLNKDLETMRQGIFLRIKVGVLGWGAMQRMSIWG